ncbi:MAG TPA: 1,2-phenylacetyl-CoA epoxidase subunit PaaC [Actinomycetota bacterium]|nr:1,2-phenylacetyl-CoA epoxidase subunit PaaC [Actinomycetota bacterium]
MGTDPRIGLLLALADDELILGHRLSEWTGWVPYIEEDLALSSIAQDEMAHARALYEIVSSLDGREVDALALGREPSQYRNAVLCERPNADFAYTVARQWLYDTADDVRLRALDASTFKELREVARVFRLEERYHLDHADAWFRRLSGGPVEARRRFTEALARALPEALALFEPLDGEDALIADGTLPRAHADLLAEWLAAVGATLEAAGLDHVLTATIDQPAGEMVPTSAGAMETSAPATPPLVVPDVERRDGRWVHAGGFSGAGGRRGEHSSDFEPLWQELTGLYRAHPGARW